MAAGFAAAVAQPVFSMHIRDSFFVASSTNLFGSGFDLGTPNHTFNKWFDAFMHRLDVNGFLKS